MGRTQDDTITVAEAYEQYPDEWVLMEITQPHADYRKERGSVLAHSQHRGAIDAPHRQARRQHPDSVLFTFFAGEVVPEGVTVIL